MKLPNDAIVFSTSEAVPSPAYQPIASLPLVIVIGLTGVGKSTILDHLAGQGLDFSLLPNRRTVADRVIIASLQVADGDPVQPVHDRVKRFEYTARYRAQNSGGIAHALSQIRLNPAKAQPLLIFDGLRGLDEVQYAVQHLP
ncbi:MAG: ATPase, partial [Anaerolineae bacterium]|nr:ATPase [Anaerolineae bacterium]